MISEKNITGIRRQTLGWNFSHIFFITAKSNLKHIPGFIEGNRISVLGSFCWDDNEKFLYRFNQVRAMPRKTNERKRNRCGMGW